MKNPEQVVNPKLTRAETAKLAILAQSDAASSFADHLWGRAAEFYELAAKLCSTLDKSEAS